MKKRAQRAKRWIIVWEDVCLDSWDSSGLPWWGPEDEAIIYITKAAAELECRQAAKRAPMTDPKVRVYP